VKKVVPSTGETTVFVYAASGKLVAEYSTLVTPQQDAKVSYLTTDHLGSPRINTDQNGAVRARHDYQPFGEEIQRASYGGDTVRKQFTGYERDKETELDFAQARYFNSGFGRFSSPDDFLNDTHASDPKKLESLRLCQKQSASVY
jgi:RHS repeat-associated protein